MWEVIDLVYLEDEGNVVFQGTQEECNRWVAEQKDAFTYQVVPIIESMYAVLVEYTDNRFDNPIYFAIGYGKSSAILSVKELIEFAEQGNKGEETISVPGLYTENKIYINTAAVFGIKGLLLTQKGHAGVSNLNLGELKKVLKKLEDRK